MSTDMLEPGLARRIEKALGAPPRRASALAGGDIHKAMRVELDDGRRVFVKTDASAPPDMFAKEASGLAWLGEPGALRVPRVLGFDDRMLALELIEPAAPSPRFEEAFGRGLALVHRAFAPSFGLEHDNYIATLVQSNSPRDDWATFYREARLEPRIADASRLLDSALRRRLDRLLERLASFVGPPEPPARLHGDLWSGNLIRDEHGMPTLIDPAVYGGHREIDLAMVRLFGTLSSRALAAYEEVYPLAPGHEDRVGLYHLYPLLVHVCLFGGGYVGAVARVVSRYV